MNELMLIKRMKTSTPKVCGKNDHEEQTNEQTDINQTNILSACKPEGIKRKRRNKKRNLYNLPLESCAVTIELLFVFTARVCPEIDTAKNKFVNNCT